MFATCAGTTANNLEARVIVGCLFHCRFQVSETRVTGEVNFSESVRLGEKCLVASCTGHSKNSSLLQRVLFVA
jgi:hypothetical protein